MKSQDYQTIIWDWNGTLLNDVDMCIHCMNQLLEPRQIPLLTKDIYRSVFTFPVQTYYEKIGIDFEKDPFDIIGHDFMDLYFAALPYCKLHKEAISVLEHFQRQGKKQFILSAMEHQALVQAMKDYKIDHFFDAVFGIDNHLAAGKIARGQQMVKYHQIQTSSTLLIGDTIHDREVAKELMVDNILISNGHQSKERLKESGAKVLMNLSNLLEF